MQTQVPGTGTAHRESPQRDATVVDAEPPLDIGQGLEHVGLASVTIGVVGATKDIQLQKHLALGQRLALVLSNKTEFVERASTAMQLQVQSVAGAGTGIDPGGQRNGIRLDRTVHLGIVTPDRAAGPQHPGGFSGGQFFSPSRAGPQGLLGVAHPRRPPLARSWCVELLVTHRPFDRLGEHLDICHQSAVDRFVSLQLVNPRDQRLAAGLQPGSNLCRR